MIKEEEMLEGVAERIDTIEARMVKHLVHIPTKNFKLDSDVLLPVTDAVKHTVTLDDEKGHKLDVQVSHGDIGKEVLAVVFDCGVEGRMLEKMTEKSMTTPLIDSEMFAEAARTKG
ncbi:unnamed protein product [Vicia faba]|uniref:Uncharacterized protein n=1 Tax=Vicia faba TaxID=3906 RepID=A0AAV0YWQ6_VICFA|nr:unnamed protein product [Vicia faba]